MSFIRKSIVAAALSALVAAPAAAEEIPFRISLNTGPNHVRNISLEAFFAALAERTEGQLDVQVFPSSQLFAGPDVPRALAQGAIEMGVPIITYLSSVVPNAGLLDLPMFFGRTIEDIHTVMDGEIGAELNAQIEEVVGVHVIGPYLDLGHGTIFTTKRELNSLADLDGLTLRVPGSPASRVRYDSLGVQSVAIGFADVPIALSQGSIDGLMTTHETIRSAQLWESGLKYAIDTQGTFLMYVPMIGLDTWNSFDPELQQIITDTWAETVGGARALAAERQASARAEAEANGVRVVQAAPEELAAFREALLAAQDQIVKDTRMDADLVERASRALSD
jgi:TRAP-type transport system periplasmic protein